MCVGDNWFVCSHNIENNILAGKLCFLDPLVGISSLWVTIMHPYSSTTSLSSWKINYILMVFYLVISYFIAFTCYCTDLLDIFSLWHWIHCVLLALLPTGEKIYLRWVTILYGTSCQFLELGEGQSSICFWNSSKITFDNLNVLSWPKYASYTIGSLLISFPVKNTWGLKKRWSNLVQK